jgi:hypothetical protein
MPLGSATAKNAAVNAMFGDAKAAGMPATLYVALYIGDPGSGGLEVVGNNYARVAVVNTNAVWGAATAGVKSSLIEVPFPVATANWGTVTHVALFDAVTVGNMWDYGPLDAATVVNSGWIARLLIGQLRVSVV